MIYLNINLFLKCLFCSVLYLLAFPGAMKAGFVFTEGCAKAHREIVNLNFNEARQILAAEKKADPANIIPYYVESYIDFVTAFISEEKTDFENLKEKRIERLNLINKEQDTSPYYLLTKAEINLETAIVKLKFEEYITAAYELRRAYKMLEENEKKFPGFVPNKKCLGLLHALIGAVPSNYKWLTKVLGFKGTIEQGLGELHELLKISETRPEYAYMREETLIILMFFEFHLLKNNKSAMELAKKIQLNNPGQLQLFAVNSIYMYSGENDKCIELLQNISIPKNRFRVHYLSFMLGIAKLNKLDMSAANDFENYVNNFKGNSFVKAAYNKLAWISFFTGDTSGYFKNMNLVRIKGNDFTDEDKQALKETKSPQEPNYYLLRSRLLFDGGYYQRALTELAGKPVSDFPKFEHQLEFTYRIARIYDKLEIDDKAIKYYEQTIKNGESQTFYFAANSAMYLGLLYENRGDKQNAINYYKKCLSMRNHDYQNSIDQKAESGLNRLNAN